MDTTAPAATSSRLGSKQPVEAQRMVQNQLKTPEKPLRDKTAEISGP
jgi:hypothetical protein